MKFCCSLVFFTSVAFAAFNYPYVMQDALYYRWDIITKPIFESDFSNIPDRLKPVALRLSAQYGTCANKIAINENYHNWQTVPAITVWNHMLASANGSKSYLRQMNIAKATVIKQVCSFYDITLPIYSDNIKFLKEVRQDIEAFLKFSFENETHFYSFLCFLASNRDAVIYRRNLNISSASPCIPKAFYAASIRTKNYFADSSISNPIRHSNTSKFIKVSTQNNDSNLSQNEMAHPSSTVMRRESRYLQRVEPYSRYQSEFYADELRLSRVMYPLTQDFPNRSDIYNDFSLYRDYSQPLERNSSDDD